MDRLSMTTLAAAKKYTDKHGGGGGGGTSNYNVLENKPQVNGNTLSGNKTGADLGLVDAVSGKSLSSNDYSNADKAIVDGVTSALAEKADKSELPDVATASDVGLVKPDGTTVTVDANGVLTAVGGGGSGNTKLKTRYSISYSSWSSSPNSDGYYTYSLTLSPTLDTTVSPDVLIAGSSNTSQPTDTHKTMFGYVERCYLSGASLTLYAKTKPTDTFYIWVEGVAGSGSGSIVGNVIQPNGESSGGSEFTNVTTLHVLNQAGAGDEKWNDPSTEANGQYRNYFAYGTAADITKIRASKYIRVNILRKYTSGSSTLFDLWSTTLIDVATLKSIETAQNSRHVRVVLTSPDTFYLYPVGNIFIYPLGTASQDKLLVQFAESTQLYDIGANYHVYDVIIDCI